MVETYFILLKKDGILKLKGFQYQIWPQWKDRENIYQVRQILMLFCTLVALILGWNFEKLQSLKKKNLICSVLVQFRSKKLFVETTIHKILETNSSFCLKECITGKIPFPFFSSFLLILMKFSFCKEEWAWDNNSIRFSDFSDIS